MWYYVGFLIPYCQTFSDLGPVALAGAPSGLRIWQ